MSGKERERIKIMAGVTEAELTLVAAAGLLDVCYRQSKRIWRQYQALGDAGLVHWLRDKPGAGASPRRCGRRCWLCATRNATSTSGVA